MSANLNPNLFRLSLPEWLKEQVESGKHKGVFWIDEKEKIFHVPWKHASRNGWEDGDVSLFKAWATYTNRYREGIDKPRPALWKTNFRCAINSHNYISFMKDQGQRKGDKAHRIMKLMEPPKECKSKLIDNCNNVEPLRKRVRITYPSTNDQARKRVRSSYSNPMSNPCNKINEKYDLCDCRRNGKLELCGNCKLDNMVDESEHEYLTNSNVNIYMMKNEANTKDGNLNYNSNFFKPKFDTKTKPNLEDLFFVGKALQSMDDPKTGLDISLKTHLQNISNELSSQLVVGKIIKDEIDEDDMKLNKHSITHVGHDFFDIDKHTDADVKDEEGDDDDLITPRDS